MQNYLCTICKHPDIKKRFGVIDRMIIRFYIKITINQLEHDCSSFLKTFIVIEKRSCWSKWCQNCFDTNICHQHLSTRATHHCITQFSMTILFQFIKYFFALLTVKSQFAIQGFYLSNTGIRTSRMHWFDCEDCFITMDLGSIHYTGIIFMSKEYCRFFLW